MRFTLLIFTIFLVIFSCKKENIEEKTLTIYTSRHYNIDAEIVERFEEKTGITVSLAQAKDNELIERLKAEGENSPADLYWNAAVSKMALLKAENLLGNFDEDVLTMLPNHLKDEDGNWVAVTYRARILAYDPEKTDVSELSSYENLASPEWAERLLVRSSTSAYNQALVASQLLHHSDAEVKEWMKGMVGNFARAPQGGDRDQARAIVAGLGDVAIMNTYYLGLLLNSEDPKDVEVGTRLKAFFPNQDTTGTHINASSIALLKSAKHKEEAKEFVQFLLSEEIQGFITRNNYEFPVNQNVELDELLKNWGTPLLDKVDFNELGKKNEQAVKLMNEAGWL